MTNRNIIDFIGKYGIFLVLLILFVWLALPKIYKAVYPPSNLNQTTCSVDQLNVGTLVSFQGKTLVVTESDYFSYIGKADIELEDVSNNNQ